MKTERKELIFAKDKYPIMQRYAILLSNAFIQAINHEAAEIPDEGCEYPSQCLLEMVVAELEKAV
jgi:hypothetical protein